MIVIKTTFSLTIEAFSKQIRKKEQKKTFVKEREKGKQNKRRKHLFNVERQ